MAEWTRTEDDVAIAYQVEGQGCPLLFVHGLGDDRQIWRSLLPHFVPAHTCITLDLRGHGASGLAADYDPFGLARDVHAVVRAVGCAQAVLVGHSLGGFAVSAAAVSLPTRAVINVDQPLAFVSMGAGVRSLRAAIEQGPAGEIVMGVLESLGLGPLTPAQRAALVQTRSHLRNDVLRGIWGLLLDHSDTAIAARVDSMLGSLRCPYLSLHSTPPPPDYASWLSARLPSAQVRELALGLGHFPQLVAPELLAQEITGFLRGLPGT